MSFSNAHTPAFTRLPPAFPYAAVLVVAFALPLFHAALLAPAVVLAALAAFFGSFRGVRHGGWHAVRSALLAASAFGFPLFLGGRMLPWSAVALAGALILARWWTHATHHEHLTTAQVMVAALAIGVSASATAFFFPAAQAYAAGAALLAFGTLCISTAPARMLLHMVPAPEAGAALLVLAETMLVLRALPLHWVVSGAILACVAVALLERALMLRTMVTALAGLLLVFGATVAP